MDPQIRFLGGYSLCDLDGRQIRLPTRKCWALLAYLAMADDRDIPREELAALLWPRSSDTNARASLRQEMAVLRKAILRAGLPDIDSSKEHVRLNLPATAVDALHMASLVKDPAIGAQRQAVACYGGEFLKGLNVASHPFEDWQWVERLRLKALAQTAYLQLLERDAEGPDTDRAIATATALLAVEPTQEHGHRALMQMYRRIGRRAEALQQFQRCVAILARELDTEPSQETVDLAEHIRADLEGRRRNGAWSGNGAAARQVSMSLSAPRQEAVHTLILLHAGLAGVEALYPRLDPKDFALAQDRFVDQCARLIAKNGGHLLTCPGDAVLCCFGYPDLKPTDLDHAVRAAQAIVGRVFDVHADASMQARAGLVRGKVLIRADPTSTGRAQAVGIAVRQAQNLAQSARGGDVVISADLRSRVGTELITDDIPVGPAQQPRGYLLRSGTSR